MLKARPQPHRPRRNPPKPQMQVKLHHKPHPPVYHLRRPHHRLQLVVAERLGLRHLHAGRQPLIHFPQRFISQQLPPVHPQNHIGADMLNRLKRRNRPPESRPILGILNPHLRILPRRPHHLRAQQSRRQIQHLPRRRPALMQFPHQVSPRYPYPVKINLALLILGQGSQRRLRHPRAVRIHHQQRQPGVILRSRRRAAHHQTLIGGVKVVHKVFNTVQYQILPVLRRRRLRRFRQIARIRLRKRPSQNPFPPAHRRQQLPLLLLRPVPRNGNRRHRARVQRRRRNGTPHFLQNDAQISQRQTLPAILLRQRNADPPQFRHLLPQLRRIPQVILLHLPGQPRRTLRLQKLPGQVLHHLFLFVRQYVHKFL